MQLVVKLPNESEGQKEWAIIEMQGDLESRFGTQVSFEGKFIGDLHFNKADGAPILIIGHHILNGKIVDIQDPIILMRKKHGAETEIPGTDPQNLNKPVHMKPETVESYFTVEAVVKKKLLFKTRPKPIIVVPKGRS